MTVGSSLVRAYLLNFIRTLMLRRSLMNAVVVGKLSDRSHPSFFTRKTTMERKNFECDKCGESFIQRTSLLLHGKIHGEKSHFDCGKALSQCSSLSVYIRKSTLLKMSTSAENVRKPSFACHLFLTS